MNLMNNLRPLLVSAAATAALAFTTEARADARLRGGASGVIAAGASHAFVIEQGTPFNSANDFAWGTNTHNELGFTSGTTTSPAPIGPLYSRLAAGTNYSLAISYTGELYGWGATNLGQTGVSVSTTAVKAPTSLPTVNEPNGAAAVWKAVA